MIAKRLLTYAIAFSIYVIGSESILAKQCNDGGHFDNNLIEWLSSDRGVYDLNVARFNSFHKQENEADFVSDYRAFFRQANRTAPDYEMDICIKQYTIMVSRISFALCSVGRAQGWPLHSKDC